MASQEKKVKKTKKWLIDILGRLYDACVNGVLDYGVVVVVASLHTILALDVLSFPSTLNFQKQLSLVWFVWEVTTWNEKYVDPSLSENPSSFRRDLYVKKLILTTVFVYVCLPTFQVNGRHFGHRERELTPLTKIENPKRCCLKRSVATGFTTRLYSVYLLLYKENFL